MKNNISRDLFHWKGLYCRKSLDGCLVGPPVTISCEARYKISKLNKVQSEVIEKGDENYVLGSVE